MARRTPFDFDANLRRAFISRVSALTKSDETPEDSPDRVLTVPTPRVLDEIIDEARQFTLGARKGATHGER